MQAGRQGCWKCGVTVSHWGRSNLRFPSLKHSAQDGKKRTAVAWPLLVCAIMDMISRGLGGVGGGGL